MKGSYTGVNLRLRSMSLCSGVWLIFVHVSALTMYCCVSGAGEIKDTMLLVVVSSNQVTPLSFVKTCGGVWAWCGGSQISRKSSASIVVVCIYVVLHL